MSSSITFYMTLVDMVCHRVNLPRQAARLASQTLDSLSLAILCAGILSAWCHNYLSHKFWLLSKFTLQAITAMTLLNLLSPQHNKHVLQSHLPVNNISSRWLQKSKENGQRSVQMHYPQGWHRVTVPLSIKTEVWIHNVNELWEYDTVHKISY